MLDTYLNKIFICISLPALLFFTLACSEKNADAPYYNKVHSQTWYNPQFLNTEQFHGTEVEAQGTSTCIKCHDINGEGQKDMPGCFKCHFGPDGSKVPVESDWTHGLDRHTELQGNQAVCNSCHDLGRDFGTGPETCHDCHDIESHVLGQTWLDRKSAEFHGEQPQADCASCHNLSVKCSQCHFDATGSKAPIGSGWAHGNNDAHEDYETQVDTCNKCHTLNRSYGNDPVSCHDCHDIESHVLGQTWLDRKSAEFHGEQPQADCASCHNLSVKCSQCHFGTTGSKTPIGSGWPHGRIDGHNDRKSSIDTCNQCHTLNRSYGNGPSNCHDCHEG